MNTRSIAVAAGVVLFIAVIVVGSSAYRVVMTDWVVITQFGQPVEGSEKIGPGLHFKKPFIQTVRRIEKRIIAWDAAPDQFVTRDKKNIFVDSYARWRVEKPLEFLLDKQILFPGQLFNEGAVDPYLAICITCRGWYRGPAGEFFFNLIRQEE